MPHPRDCASASSLSGRGGPAGGDARDHLLRHVDRRSHHSRNQRLTRGRFEGYRREGHGSPFLMILERGVETAAVLFLAQELTCAIAKTSSPGRCAALPNSVPWLSQTRNHAAGDRVPSFGLVLGMDDGDER